ncbi:MAG: hypothetical protein AABX51_07760 [Nanoarchaeota archaeon]
MECNFTYNHFREAIGIAKDSGFSFFTMHDVLIKKPSGKIIVLRHDVDLSMKHALKMAETERMLGINSTYFFRVNEIVNPFSGKNSEMLRKIAKMGHEIGLHYDSDVISLDDFKEYLLDKKKKLEIASGSKVYGAALHRVKKLGAKNIETLNFIEGFLGELGLEYDAYSEKFFKQLKYISDSARHWKEGCMCQHIGKWPRLYILTHPIWWSDTTTSLVSIIEELI